MDFVENICLICKKSQIPAWESWTKPKNECAGRKTEILKKKMSKLYFAVVKESSSYDCCIFSMLVMSQMSQGFL